MPTHNTPKILAAVLALTVASQAQALETTVAGPFEITLPAGFELAGQRFVDQNPALPGVQIAVTIVQGSESVPDFIAFRTDSVESGGRVSIGHTTTPDHTGHAAGGFVRDGVLYAYGVRGDEFFVWTPSFNSGPRKYLAISQPRSESCTLVTVPDYAVGGAIARDQDDDSDGLQACI